MAPATIRIAPSTYQRLHLARRRVSFRGIDQSWGNYLAAAVLLSASLFCASLEKSRGPLKALDSAPSPNSSTPNFNLDKPLRSNSRKLQRNHRDKKHPSSKPPPFPQTRLTSPCRPVASRVCDRTLRFLLNITGGYWADHSHEHARSAKAQPLLSFSVLGDFGRCTAGSELSLAPACSRPTTGESASLETRSRCCGEQMLDCCSSWKGSKAYSGSTRWVPMFGWIWSGSGTWISADPKTPRAYRDDKAWPLLVVERRGFAKHGRRQPGSPDAEP